MRGALPLRSILRSPAVQTQAGGADAVRRDAANPPQPGGALAGPPRASIQLDQRALLHHHRFGHVEAGEAGLDLVSGLLETERMDEVYMSGRLDLGHVDEVADVRQVGRALWHLQRPRIGYRQTQQLTLTQTRARTHATRPNTH